MYIDITEDRSLVKKLYWGKFWPCAFSKALYSRAFQKALCDLVEEWIQCGHKMIRCVFSFAYDSCIHFLMSSTNITIMARLDQVTLRNFCPPV